MSRHSKGNGSRGVTRRNGKSRKGKSVLDGQSDLPAVDPNFELDAASDPRRFIAEIGRRESRRSGPGTAARRTLEAMAESARLSQELSGLDDYSDFGND